MHFNTFAVYLEKLESTASRLEMYVLLAELFKEAAPEEVAPLAYLCEGQLLPAFEGLETGMGERFVASAIASAVNLSAEEVAQLSIKSGDLGLVAEEVTPPERRSQLMLLNVYERLLQIARTSGRGSADEKQRQLTELLQVATPIEARYIVRITLGRLRLGVGAPTIIEAVARTTDQAKEARRIIERAYNTCSDLGLVLKQMAEKGLPELQEFKVNVGRPVRPMLAERLPGADEVIKKIGTCAVEAKLDGFRCQVHLQSDCVDMFSRNLEKTTGMFPELADAARHDFDAETAIIDGEALAINEETGEFYPFQVTVQRKRKHQVERMAEEFPLVLVAFDLLYVNGRDLTNLSYSERRAELASRLKMGGRIRLSEGEVVSTAEELQAFFDKGLEKGHEGVVAKRVSSSYEPGARNFNWIKLKRAYKGELNDTVDLVLIGYLRGRGARAKLGIGSLLGAVYDQPTDTFKSVAKIGSGLSEENWVKIKALLDISIVDHKPPRVDSRLVPDVWVEPQIVVTVLADELTRSPIHTAAQDADGRGLALRFPRVVNFVREDKSPEDATTAKEIEDIYNQQKRSQSKT